MHVLQRTIDKVNGYIYGISDEAKEAYMMSSEPLQPAAPAYVGALLTPQRPALLTLRCAFLGGRKQGRRPPGAGALRRGAHSGPGRLEKSKENA